MLLRRGSTGIPEAILTYVLPLLIYSVEKPLRSEEHTSELQSRQYLVCRLLLEKKKDRNPHPGVANDPDVTLAHIQFVRLAGPCVVHPRCPHGRDASRPCHRSPASPRGIGVVG